MDDFISREEFAANLADIQYGEAPTGRAGENIDYQNGVYAGFDMAYVALMRFPAANAVEVVRCKDCKHRPVVVNPGKPYGFGLEGPDYDEICPYLVDDGYYNRMPEDDWFCHFGEKKNG